MYLCGSSSYLLLFCLVLFAVCLFVDVALLGFCLYDLSVCCVVYSSILFVCIYCFDSACFECILGCCVDLIFVGLFGLLCLRVFD